ncbi:M23 family metallopeptidase [Thermosulfuriphilus sp.]
MSRLGIISLILGGLFLWKSSLLALDLPKEVGPGDVFLLSVAGQAEKACLLGYCFPLARLSDRSVGFIGIPYGASEGETSLEICFTSGSKKRVSLKIRARLFPEEHLKLPQKMVTFDLETLDRIKKERVLLRQVLEPVSRDYFYLGPFVPPVDGRISSPFGLKRILNGQPRSPHMGVDFAARQGSPVVAFGTGKVVLVRDFYLSGLTVVIDHGLGLYSIYCHLDKALVTAGETVTVGQRIGLVGKSGRATGPHLHFGVSLVGIRVDPLRLLELGAPGLKQTKERSHAAKGL